MGLERALWLDLQSQYDIAVVENERGAEIARRVRPADAACPASLRARPTQRPEADPIGLGDRRTEGPFGLGLRST